MSLWATCNLETDGRYVLMLASTQTLTKKGNFLCAQLRKARRLALHLYSPRCELANGSNPSVHGWYI